jgi:hypothetical protein
MFQDHRNLVRSAATLSRFFVGAGGPEPNRTPTFSIPTANAVIMARCHRDFASLELTRGCEQIGPFPTVDMTEELTDGCACA